MVVIAALVLLAGTVAGPAEGDVLAEFDHAAKCRVHTEMLPAVFAAEPKRQKWGRAVFGYWEARSDRIGVKAGFKPEELPTRYLMIPIKPDMEFINGCIEEAKKDGLRVRPQS